MNSVAEGVLGGLGAMTSELDDLYPTSTRIASLRCWGGGPPALIAGQLCEAGYLVTDGVGGPAWWGC